MQSKRRRYTGGKNGSSISDKKSRKVIGEKRNIFVLAVLLLPGRHCQSDMLTFEGEEDPSVRKSLRPRGGPTGREREPVVSYTGISACDKCQKGPLQ
jgi:hypothetical protein